MDGCKEVIERATHQFCGRVQASESQPSLVGRDDILPARRWAGLG